jgi:sec-independent protein translocase protein TatA
LVFVHDIVQPTHLLLLLLVALFVLGPRRLPSAARSIGRGVHDFRAALTGEARPPQTGPSGHAD